MHATPMQHELFWTQPDNAASKICEFARRIVISWHLDTLVISEDESETCVGSRRRASRNSGGVFSGMGQRSAAQIKNDESVLGLQAF